MVAYKIGRSGSSNMCSTSSSSTQCCDDTPLSSWVGRQHSECRSSSEERLEAEFHRKQRDEVRFSRSVSASTTHLNTNMKTVSPPSRLVDSSHLGKTSWTPSEKSLVASSERALSTHCKLSPRSHLENAKQGTSCQNYRSQPLCRRRSTEFLYTNVKGGESDVCDFINVMGEVDPSNDGSPLLDTTQNTRMKCHHCSVNPRDTENLDKQRRPLTLQESEFNITNSSNFSASFLKSKLLSNKLPSHHHRKNSFPTHQTLSFSFPFSNSMSPLELLESPFSSNVSSISRRVTSIFSSSSSPFVFTSLLLYTLVWTAVLGSPSVGATPYPPSKFAQDSYGSWDRSLTLDDRGFFVVEWTASSTDIQFRLTARTRGYIGFGVSSQSRMHGADIVVGWVHSGKAYLQDRHGLGNLEPAVDRYQDWTIVSGYENDTHTVLHVSRPLDTCDPEHDHAISNDTSRLLWAYHPDDPVDPDSPRPRLHYHGDFRRGAKSVFLLDRDPGAGYRSSEPSYGRGRNDRHPTLENPHTWTLNSPGVEVKSDMATVYWCKLFRKPLLVQKNHIIKFEPVFSAGNARHVHHMTIYECASEDPSLTSTLDQLADTNGHQCYSEQMAPLLKACSHVVVAWAVGSQGLTLPPEAGYPLSPNGPAIFLMLVHYDNPDNRHFRDHSGIRVHYTHVLRSYDAGVLSVGLDPNWKHLIPPKQASVLSSGHCVAECTAKALPATGIQVFGAVVQTHLLGREVKIRHLRHGVELDPIAQDKNFDYNYLEYRLMKKPKTVLPGDHLISECRYNSLERSAITLGGINTRDEMCLSYLYYWPRTSLSLCHSKPSLNTVLQSLGIQELSHDSEIIKIRKPVELAGKTLEWRLVNYDWQYQFEYFQTTTHTGTFNPMCRSRGHSLLPILEEVDYEYPNISEPWVAEDTCRRPQWPHPKDSNPHHRRQRPHHRRQHPHLSDGLQDDAEPPRSEDQLLSSDGDNPAGGGGGGGGDDEGGVGSYDGSDVMFDDDINTKPIKRIDADPVHKFDVFMPIREDFFEPKNQGSVNNPLDTTFQASESSSGTTSGNFGTSGRTVNTRNRSPYDDEDLRQEFDAMERDLEEEVNHNKLPDSFQERTAHKARANRALRIGSPLWLVHGLTLGLLFLLTRLKEGFC